MLAIALMISCLAPPGLAEDAQPENQWVDPKLDPNAIPWDDTHPELLEDEMLVARSAILIEASTGEVLFEKNADEIMFPASTTKIMTAYIALQMADFENDVVTMEFGRDGIMVRPLLEKKSALIEAALSEAFGREMHVRMVNAGARPMKTSAAAKNVIEQSYDIFGRDKIELTD